MPLNGAIPDAAERRTAIRSRVARALLSMLSSECKGYCILSGYEQLPDSFDTDIDFMVHDEDFERMPQLMAALARRTETVLFQSVEHEVSARAFFLAAASGSELTIVQLDASADYRHYGLLWLRAGEVLQAVRPHARGFNIPSAAHEFIYYLIKHINKRDFRQQHGERLHRLYREDQAGCDHLLARFWGRSARAKLSRMAYGNEWREMPGLLRSLRGELRRHPAESLAERAVSVPKQAAHWIKRVVQPTGTWIAFMGPDGCGKSTVIQAVGQGFVTAFRKVARFHMRPRLLGGNRTSQSAVTDPHGQAMRGWAASVAKVFYFATDYWLGYLLRVLPGVIRTRLVIFDRYIYDLLIDSKRVRYGGPRWLLRLAARIVPRPDLIILLDAPPAMLWSRKQEVAFKEVERQREAFLRMASGLPRAVVVNAAQPLPDVVEQVNGTILAHLSQRQSKRLKLHLALPDAKEVRHGLLGDRS